MMNVASSDAKNTQKFQHGAQDSHPMIASLTNAHAVILSSKSVTNYYIKIGLTRDEVKLLSRIGKECGVRKSPCATAARWFLLSALPRSKEIRSKILQLVKDHAGNCPEINLHCAGAIQKLFAGSDSENSGQASRNWCARINMEPIEVKTLLWWRRKRFRKQSNLSNVAHWILLLALNHPEIVEQWMNQLVSYCDAENVSQGKFMIDSLNCKKEFRRVDISKVKSN